MKTPGTIKWKRPLFKSMLALACFVHFIPQLSPKFYLYASSPTAYFNPHKAAAACRQTSGHEYKSLTSLAATTSPSLSIDKRYNLEHVFALFPFFPALPGPVETGSIIAPPALATPTVLHSIDRLMRGPPASLPS